MVSKVVAMNLEQLITHQILFSLKTFGPGLRQEGLLRHIEKEMNEVRSADEHAVDEWADIILLAIDGAWRSWNQIDDIESAPLDYAVFIAQGVSKAIELKLLENQYRRQWPELGTVPEDAPTEHIRETTE